MSATRTVGITTDANGDYLIDKRHLGQRICVRLRQSTIDEAESRLKQELGHLEMELARRAQGRPLFRDCAARYLSQRHERRSFATMQIHARGMLAYIGDLEPHQVHDATLAPFVSSRIAAGASATTINRSLEVVRAIASIERYFRENFEERIGNIAAGALLGFMLEEIAPSIYNRAVADVQERMTMRVAELDIEVHEDEFGYWRKFETDKRGRGK